MLSAASTCTAGDNNPGFMLLKCKRSCQVCEKAPAELQALIRDKAAAVKAKQKQQAAELESQEGKQQGEQQDTDPAEDAVEANPQAGATTT